MARNGVLTPPPVLKLLIPFPQVWKQKTRKSEANSHTSHPT